MKSNYYFETIKFPLNLKIEKKMSRRKTPRPRKITENEQVWRTRMNQRVSMQEGKAIELKKWYPIVPNSYGLENRVSQPQLGTVYRVLSSSQSVRAQL